MDTRDSDERKLLGKRLREAREYLEISQDEVAKTLGLPRTAISLIESGRRKVDTLELKKMAQIYQLPVSHFTETKEENTESPAEVQHLARAASSLSEKDLQELLQFARFLQSKAEGQES